MHSTRDSKFLVVQAASGGTIELAATSPTPADGLTAGRRLLMRIAIRRMINGSTRSRVPAYLARCGLPSGDVLDRADGLIVSPHRSAGTRIATIVHDCCPC